MQIKELLEQINQSKRKKLVKFLQDRDFSDTKIKLLAGDLKATGRKDKGTISLAICSHYIYDKSGKTWDFIIVTDKMATKEEEESFSMVSMDAEVVRIMLPPLQKASIDESCSSDIENIGVLKYKVEHLQQEYDTLKRAYELVNGYLDSSNKQVAELSSWKSSHSGNYRHAGRPKKFSEVDQGESIYKMHTVEKLSFRKIAEVMDMSYSSTRRLYQNYVNLKEKLGW